MRQILIERDLAQTELISSLFSIRSTKKNHI